MTTPSYKVLARVVPVAALLVVVLAVAVLAGPSTFKYRGWPKPPRTTPLQSLVGLTPRLDVRDPIGVGRDPQPTARGDATARSASRSTSGVTPHATIRPRGGNGSARQGSAAAGQSGVQSQRAVPGRRAGEGRKSGRRDRAPRDHQRFERKPATTASEAGFARQVGPSHSAPRTPSPERYYAARFSRERRVESVESRPMAREAPRSMGLAVTHRGRSPHPQHPHGAWRGRGRD